MAKIINLTNYKSKKETSHTLTKEERLESFKRLLIDDDEDYEFEDHKNKYLEAYKNMDKEKRKMLNDWLSDEM